MPLGANVWFFEMIEYSNFHYLFGKTRYHGRNSDLQDYQADSSTSVSNALGNIATFCFALQLG